MKNILFLIFVSLLGLTKMHAVNPVMQKILNSRVQLVQYKADTLCNYENGLLVNLEDVTYLVAPYHFLKGYTRVDFIWMDTKYTASVFVFNESDDLFLAKLPEFIPDMISFYELQAILYEQPQAQEIFYRFPIFTNQPLLAVFQKNETIRDADNIKKTHNYDVFEIDDNRSIKGQSGSLVINTNMTYFAMVSSRNQLNWEYMYCIPGEKILELFFIFNKSLEYTNIKAFIMYYLLKFLTFSQILFSRTCFSI